MTITDIRSNHGEFQYALRGFITNPPDGSVQMVVPPHGAKWLVENFPFPKNRPINESRIGALQADIARGEWRVTGVPIIISAEGTVMDGHHRLTAISRGIVPVAAMFQFGIPSENFTKIDTGMRSRTAGDIFSMRGVPSSNLTAGAVKFVIKYDSKRMTSKEQGRFTLTPDLLYEKYLAMPGFQDSVRFTDRHRKTSILSPKIAAGAHYVCSRIDPVAADIFFSKLLTGLGIDDAKDPAGRLRTMLINNKGSVSSFLPVAVSAYVFKAWNASREGRVIGSFRWRATAGSTESFPAAK